jgi:hypothetical protein
MVASHWPHTHGDVAIGESHPGLADAKSSSADDDSVAERYGLHSRRPTFLLINNCPDWSAVGSRIYLTSDRQPDNEITPELVTRKLVIAGL